MVSNVVLDDEDMKETKQEHTDDDGGVNTHSSLETQCESIELIDKLSRVEHNVNIVIKENTVNALKIALSIPNSSDMSEEDKQTKDKLQYIAAKALGTITKHKKAALRIGRDANAIVIVLDSIRSKPKFTRLVTYSLNCVSNLAVNKHNWESIVELGGIDVAIECLKNHVGNANVLKEVTRLFSQLCKNKQYAKIITGVFVIIILYLFEY